MGRGRQKAKQTKVARELKYHSSSIDVHALQRELAGQPAQTVPEVDVEDDDDEDPYASYADDGPEDDSDDDSEPAGGYASTQSRRR